ncbi:MAG TPA: N-6 DNA methylase [Planctomycetota bacterium]|nr:N-6 DNA methylase [Planctomycetota bacterium]
MRSELARLHAALGGDRAALSVAVRVALVGRRVTTLAELDEAIEERFPGAPKRAGVPPTPALPPLRGGREDAATLAAEFERLLGTSERKRGGAWFTPSAVARVLARRTLEDMKRGTVLDPACGAGALLAAAAEVVPASVALVGIDADPDACLLARARLGTRARIRHGDALLMQLPAVEAVIANPPFVATYARGAQRVAPERRALLAARFPGVPANGFLHFLALALELARERMGLVAPDALLVNERYEDARRRLLEGGADALVLDWPAFGRASVRAALVVLDRAAAPSLRVQVFASEEALERGEPATTQSLTPKTLAERPAFAFPRGATDSRLEARIRERGVPLGDLCWVRDGINTGPRRFREKVLRPWPGRGHPCLEGKDIHPFKVSKPRLAIDTDRPIPRELKRLGASFREPWIFEKEKLVSRQTAPTLVFAREPSGMRILNSAHATGTLETTEESLLWFLALLNSSPLRWYYARTSGETRPVFPQVHVSALRRLPVPRGDGDHDAVVALARRLEAAPEDAGLLAALDELVFEILDLRDSSRRRIQAEAPLC